MSHRWGYDRDTTVDCWAQDRFGSWQVRREASRNQNPTIRRNQRKIPMLLLWWKHVLATPATRMIDCILCKYIYVYTTPTTLYVIVYIYAQIFNSSLSCDAHSPQNGFLLGRYLRDLSLQEPLAKFTKSLLELIRSIRKSQWIDQHM